MEKTNDQRCINALKAVLYRYYPELSFGFIGYKECALCMLEENGEWHVFEAERGNRYKEEVFPCVIESCIAMIRRVAFQPDEITRREFEFLDRYKGNVVVAKNLSANQQVELLTKIINDEIEILDSLPKDEAKKRALKNLYGAGIVDEDGNYTEPYKILGEVNNEAGSVDKMTELPVELDKETN